MFGIICGPKRGHNTFRYLEQERTIILAVVPSNQDVATVDILERAKIVSQQSIAKRIGFLETWLGLDCVFDFTMS